MQSSELQRLNQQISECQCAKQFRFRKQLQALSRNKTSDKAGFDKLMKNLMSDIQKSQQWVKSRYESLPDIPFSDSLPINQKRDEIAKLIQENQVVILAGETGSGKTTQIPKICLSLGLGSKGLIGHTQPRRIAQG